MPEKVEASHGMGVDITYTCTNNCTIRIYWTAYRDCDGSSSIPPTTLSINGGSGCATPLPIGNWSTTQIVEVTPVCPGIPTKCTNSSATLNGVQQYSAFRDYDFCAANCSTYTVSWSLCCRNAAITSLTGASGNNIYTGQTTINPLRTPCNNSPVFNNPPVPYICAGQPYVFNQGATDVDGDSLVYYLGPCYQGAGNFVSYNATGGFTPTTPMGPDWIVTVDSLTGDVTIAPNPTSSTPGSIQVGVLCVFVEEYRNDTLIGQVVRDMQITVIPCPNNTQPLSPGITNISGGSILPSNNFTAVTCVGSNLCFDIPIVDPDSNQNLKAWWNQSLASAGATFVNAANAAQVDTIRAITPANLTGRFCWTPASPGNYSFLVTIRDSACPIIGQAQYTFTIRVSQSYIEITDSTYDCGTADFCVDSINGISPFTYQWLGAGGLNTTDSCFTYSYAGPGIYPYAVTITDSAGCARTINDTMIVPNTVIADAGPDQTTCSGDPVSIGTLAQTDEVYNWVPTTFLNDPSLAQPTVNGTNSGTTPQIVTYIVHAWDTVTNCEDWDTVQVTINPIPESTFNLPSQVCLGQTVQVNYTGWNGNGATYQWTFGPNGVPTNTNGRGPHVVSWNNTGMQPVTLTVIENGCTSSVSIDSIMVYPIPVAAIAPEADQCFAGHSFDFTNNGTYGSSATFYWNFFPNGTPGSSSLEDPTGVTYANFGPSYASLQIEENGCISNIDTINFMLFDDPDPNWVYLGGPQCLSAGNNTYGFQANGANGPGASYSWTFENGLPATSVSQNPTISFTSAGWMTVTLVVTENGCVSTRTDSVLVYPDPVFDAGPDASFCEGEGGAQLNGSGMFGSTPYYYSWWCTSGFFCGLDSVNDNDPIANPNQSLMYYGQITDFNGCLSNVDSAFVTVIPKPIVDAGPDVYICRDSAPCQILTPNITNSPGPFSYQWSPSAGLNNDTIQSPCAHPDTTTIYTLVVVDQSTGCTSQTTTVDSNSTVTVHRPPLPVAEAGPDIDLCLGDTVMLQGYGFNAGPNYDFEWSPLTALSNGNIANPLAFPVATTDYVLTVWSNNCPSFGDTVTVNVHTNPTADAGPDVEICLGETATLTGSASGDSTATYTYFWTPATGVVGQQNVKNLEASPEMTTTYYLVATTNHGCDSPMDSAVVYLKPTPIAEAGPQGVLCFPDTIGLTGSWSTTTTPPVTDPSQVYLSWTPGSTMSDTTAYDPDVWPSQSQFYYLTVRYNTCSTTDSVLVTVLPELGLTASADTSIICGGESVQLTSAAGLGGASYTWIPATGLDDPNAQNPVASPTTSTTYIVVAEEGGCTDTVEVPIEVIPGPVAAYYSSQTDGCPDHTVSFINTATDAEHFIWNFGDGEISNSPNPTHTYTEPGQYVVTLTAVNVGGCEDEVSSIVVNVIDFAKSDFTTVPEFPSMLALPNSTVQFLDQSVDGIKWLWEFGDGEVSSEQNPQHTYTQPGEYYATLTVTNEFGCVTTIVHGPFMVNTPDLFIPNVFSPNDDGTNDVFMVEYTGSQFFNMQIYDRWGAMMYDSKNKVVGWDGLNADGQDVPEGVYFYRVAVGDREFTGAVTLMR